jgi:hypothetical protein
MEDSEKKLYMAIRDMNADTTPPSIGPIEDS